MDGGRDGRQVDPGTRAVVDQREADEGGLGAQRGFEVGQLQAVDPIGLDEPELEAARLGQALQDVAVGRELAGRGDDDAAIGARLEGGVGQPIEVDRRRVADDDLARSGAEEGGRDLVADLRREVDPLGPATHPISAPLVADQAGDPLQGRLGQPAEGVAVEVDGLGVGDLEGGSQAAQRIGGVEAFGFAAVGQRRSHGRRFRRRARRARTRSWSRRRPCRPPPWSAAAAADASGWSPR